MKIEVKEKEMLDLIVKRFANSEPFKLSLNKHIEKVVRAYSNELISIGYRKAIKEFKVDI